MSNNLNLSTFICILLLTFKSVIICGYVRMARHITYFADEGRGTSENFWETFIMDSIKSVPMKRMCYNDLSFEPRVRSILRLIPATGNQ